MRPLSVWIGLCCSGAVVAAWSASASGDRGRWAIAIALCGLALIWVIAARGRPASRPRRLLRTAAAVFATVVVCLGGAGGALWFGSESIEWSVAGVSDRGSSVVVAFPGGYAPCRGEPQVSVISQSREEVEIRARLRYSGCAVKSLHFYSPVEVRLEAPLAGRAISGPERTRPPSDTARRSPFEADNRMPDLVGLHVDDAKAALRAQGLVARRVTGNGSTVTGQTPAAKSAPPLKDAELRTAR